MKSILVLAAILFSFSFGSFDVLSQRRQSSSRELRELKEEIRTLKSGQEEIQRELREIKELLHSQAALAGRPIVLTLDDDPHLGSLDARVVIVDFSEFQCPFCGRFVRETKPLLEKEYFNTGKVRYIFRDLPLEAIHPHAFKAAEAANCAGDQGKFWEMHTRLFQNQRALAPAQLTQYAQALGLDIPQFTQCLESGKHAAEIRKDMASAASARIEGTPNFVIGLVNPKNPRDPIIKIQKIITGAHPFTTFKTELDAALVEAQKLAGASK